MVNQIKNVIAGKITSNSNGKYFGKLHKEKSSFGVHLKSLHIKAGKNSVFAKHAAALL